MSPLDAALEAPLQQVVWDGVQPLPVTGQDLVLLTGQQTNDQLLQKAVGKWRQLDTDWTTYIYCAVFRKLLSGILYGAEPL